MMRATVLLPSFLSSAALAVILSSSAAPDSSYGAEAARAAFEGRTVVVTGANRGIGLALATQLAEAGAKVIGTARRPPEAKELAETGARVLELDVTDAASVAAFDEALGETAVDLLINNAGVLLERGPILDEPDFEAVQRCFEVNAVGPMRVTHALIDNLLASDGPRVVNVSSRLGSIEDNASGGFLGYRESKAAVNMFTRSLAVEYAERGLVAICVHPGWVRTDMGGPSAPVEPEESARGMLSIVAEARAETSGRFFQVTDGSELRW